MVNKLHQLDPSQNHLYDSSVPMVCLLSSDSAYVEPGTSKRARLSQRYPSLLPASNVAQSAEQHAPFPHRLVHLARLGLRRPRHPPAPAPPSSCSSSSSSLAPSTDPHNPLLPTTALSCPVLGLQRARLRWTAGAKKKSRVRSSYAVIFVACVHISIASRWVNQLLCPLEHRACAVLLCPYCILLEHRFPFIGCPFPFLSSFLIPSAR